jgi:hypothetical protein
VLYICCEQRKRGYIVMKVELRSKEVDGKYFTCEGVEISRPMYLKEVEVLSDLSLDEQGSLLLQYDEMRRCLAVVRELVVRR